MTCFLQLEFRMSVRRNQRVVRMNFIRAFDIARTSKAYSMLIACATFSSCNVVPAISLVKMRTFNHSDICSQENLMASVRKTLFLREILSHNNARELSRTSLSVIPLHIDVPMATIVIMEHRSVKTRRIQEYRV